MLIINPELAATDERWRNYQKVKKIKNPFIPCKLKEEVHKGLVCYRQVPNEEQFSELYKQEYLHLKDIFYAWDCHFWMTDWDQFKRQCNSEGYCPCDLANRQCNMTCEYFGKNCLREKEELKCPKILGFEGRWEINYE